MSDEPSYADRTAAPKPRVARGPGELLFEFLIGHDRHRCELVDHGEYGVEALFLKNEEIDIGRTFHPRLDPTRTPRETAIAWAQTCRAGIEADARRVEATGDGLLERRKD